MVEPARCLVAGCKRRTTRFGLNANDSWICGEHWRRYIPPRSRLRKAYHALYRRGKRLDWPPELERRWWRLWAAITRRVQRRSNGGHLDVAEINRVMGWD